MSNRTAAAAEKPIPQDWPQPSLDAPVKLYGEMMRFMAQRLLAQAAFLQSLADCPNPTDLMQRQAAFMQGAVEAYATEAGRSWKILREPARASQPAA